MSHHYLRLGVLLALVSAICSKVSLTVIPLISAVYVSLNLIAIVSAIRFS